MPARLGNPLRARALLMPWRRAEQPVALDSSAPGVQGGGSDAGGTAGSSFGGSGASTPAAADFPTVGTTSTGRIADAARQREHSAGRLDPLHRAEADAARSGDLADAQAVGERRPDRLLGVAVGARPAEVLAFGPRPGDAGADALDDDRPLERGEHAQHLEQRAAGRRGRVDALLVQVELAMSGAQLAEKSH